MITLNPLHLLDPFVPIAHAALLHLDAVLAPGLGDPAVAVSLVLLTGLIRLMILPLSVRVARAERARRALAPRLAELRRTHPDDAARLLHETRAVYREAGTGPLAGFLPALLQAPALTVIYRLCTVPVVAGHPNLVLSANLFGAPLSQHGLALLATSGPAPALVFAVTVVLLAAVAAASSAVTVRRLDDATPPAARLVARVAPFGTVAAAFVVPFAVSLYLLTSTAWVTAERVVLARG